MCIRDSSISDNYHDDLNYMLRKLREYYQTVGLTINCDKSEYEMNSLNMNMKSLGNKDQECIKLGVKLLKGVNI